MTTLSDTAYYARKLIKYGAIAVVILFILRISYSIFSTIWKTVNPPQPPPASEGFGALPKIPFPEQEKPSFSFRLETVTGTTGKFASQAKVFMMPSGRAGLLALERETEQARSMGFLFEPEILSETLYQWRKTDPLPATLQIDTASAHFFYDVDWRVKPDLLLETNAVSEAEAISIARSWLSGLKKLPADMASGEAQVMYLKVSGTQLVPALSQSEAQFIRVDLYRKSLQENSEDLKILSTDPKQAYVYITFIASAGRRPEIVQAEYRYNPIDYEKYETYTLIDSKTAWSRLQQGEGYYAFIPDGLSEIIVRRVLLAYFDPSVSGHFLQPIFVFEGDGGFVGYIPAISDEWVAE